MPNASAKTSREIPCRFPNSSSCLKSNCSGISRNASSAACARPIRRSVSISHFLVYAICAIQPPVELPPLRMVLCRGCKHQTASGLGPPRCGQWCLRPRERRGGQATGRQVAVGAPFGRDGEDPLLGGEVFEPV